MGQEATTAAAAGEGSLKWGLHVRRFILRFALMAGGLLTVYYFPYDEGSLPAALRRLYLAAYAHVAGGAISLFDSTVHVVGTRIQGRLALEFAMSCDAMDVLLLFAAATCAYPASWRRRALGIAAACVSMAVINVTRVVLLYLIGLHAPARFDLFHMQLFPLVIVIVTAAGFLAWTRSLPPLAGKGDHAAVPA
jgi:exosortase/archaeosortase family protein